MLKINYSLPNNDGNSLVRIHELLCCSVTCDLVLRIQP